MSKYELTMMRLSMDQTMVLDTICEILATASVAQISDDTAKEFIMELRRSCDARVRDSLRLVTELTSEGTHD